jgi:hypothetical protein
VKLLDSSSLPLLFCPALTGDSLATHELNDSLPAPAGAAQAEDFEDEDRDALLGSGKWWFTVAQDSSPSTPSWDTAPAALAALL